MTVSGADLIDRVCQETGLDATAASSDRALVLSYLNQALAQAALDAEFYVPSSPASVSLTAGTWRYDLTSSPFAISGLVSIDEITVTDGSVTGVPLEQRTMAEVLDRQQGAGQANGTPEVYAVDYPTIAFHPTPGSGTTLSVTRTSDAVTAIADSASAVTSMPVALLWGCLAEFAIAMAKRFTKDKSWTDHMTAYQSDRVSGLPALRRWVARVGGRQRPGSDSQVVFRTSPSQDLRYF